VLAAARARVPIEPSPAVGAAEHLLGPLDVVAVPALTELAANGRIHVSSPGAVYGRAVEAEVEDCTNGQRGMLGWLGGLDDLALRETSIGGAEPAPVLDIISASGRPGGRRPDAERLISAVQASRGACGAHDHQRRLRVHTSAGPVGAVLLEPVEANTAPAARHIVVVPWVQGDREFVVTVSLRDAPDAAAAVRGSALSRVVELAQGAAEPAHRPVTRG
jgi:hypothetical protein